MKNIILFYKQLRIKFIKNTTGFIHFKKEIGWSELIALAAVILSSYAIWQSHIAFKNAKILNKLDFRPTLCLRTQLYEINNKIPAHINIKNTGPVDAVQFQIQLYFLRYLPTKKKVGIAATGSDLQWTHDRLPPLKEINININRISLANMLPSIRSDEEQYRILEIRLTYRREVDLKEYSESAFYFTNPKGRFVNENDNSLDSEIYTAIKEAAFKRFNIDKTSLDFSSDKLHSLIEKK